MEILSILVVDQDDIMIVGPVPGKLACSSLIGTVVPADVSVSCYFGVVTDATTANPSLPDFTYTATAIARYDSRNRIQYRGEAAQAIGRPLESALKL